MTRDVAGAASAGRSLTIVGGGMAGLTLGILLRQRDIPVTVLEAGTYPRHRVCGEFISGQGVNVLRQAGLLSEDLLRETRWANDALFCSAKRRLRHFVLPEPALCGSRYFLDDHLASVYRRAGGILRTGQRQVGQDWPEGWVRATGRRVQAERDGWRWFGLKLHVEEARLEADLEMHFHADRYVGLCRLPHGRVNVCGLFRSRGPARSMKEQGWEMLGGREGTLLRARLEGAKPVEETRCAVAGLDLVPAGPPPEDQCWVGDAWTMIPPLTGNGMSMAMESAWLAAEPLAEYGHGARGWREALSLHAERLEQRCRSRLRWAIRFQRALFTPGMRQLLLAMTRASGAFCRIGFARTR